GALGLGFVVGGAAGLVRGEGGKHLAGRWQAGRVDMTLGVPKLGADDGAGALEIDFVALKYQHGAWRLFLDGKAFEQSRVDGDMGAPVDAQRRAGAGDEEKEGAMRIAHDSAQAVDAVIAATVWQHDGVVVMDALI